MSLGVAEVLGAMGVLIGAVVHDVDLLGPATAVGIMFLVFGAMILMFAA